MDSSDQHRRPKVAIPELFWQVEYDEGGENDLFLKGNMMKHNQRLKTAIIEVVDNQLKANDPPEIKQTLVRLISEGFSIQEGKELIGNVVVVEIFEVLKEGKPFDIKRYVAALNRLPELPSLPSAEI